ncbi:HigA family addiction module antitoxin [Fibrella aquatilis]|uniref:HigA family addiction module antidote protein n=1 Tax=Fibrella aquatilis TaxID=2817059 RepID=A0A939G3K0_9BACT|nr:HigA family addiction module antitoxin [Fibrella aquatilis]MBO0931231.1 HigA family addiction module antidote protein [Fibrella aquatilis]
MTLSSLGEEIFPAHPTHPGEMLADELEARNITQKHLAELLGISATFISELIRGKKSVSVAMALKLEQALQIDASFWLNAQRNYNRDMVYHKAKREMKRLNVPEARQKELLKAVAS